MFSELGYGAGLLAGVILMIVIMVVAVVIESFCRWWQHRRRD